jgi:Tol biopolymer transport system component
MIVYEGDPPGAEPDSNFEIWAMGEPDWEPRALFERAGFDGHPTFSPDGGAIAFASHQGEERTLWELPAQGTARELLRGGAEIDYPRWLASGIVYGRTGYGAGGHWRLDPASGSVEPFDLGPSVDDYSFSPDGTQVAKAVVDPAGGKTRLVLAALGGGDLKTFDLNHALVIGPRWEPGGRRLAYSAKTGPERWASDVFLVDVETGAVEQVTDRPGADWVTAWSPDGAWLAVVSEWGDDWDVTVVRPDGSGRLRLTCAPGNSRYAEWSFARWP